MMNKYYKNFLKVFIIITFLFLVMFVLMDIFKIDLKFVEVKQVTAILGGIFLTITFLVILMKYLFNKKTKLSFLIPFFCGFGFFNIYFDNKILKIGIIVLSVIALGDYFLHIIKNTESIDVKMIKEENEE